MKDSEILSLLQKEDEQGFELLIDAYSSYVTAVITGICKGSLPVEDIEETAADVFYRIWKRRDQLYADSLKAYIAQTARNAAIDRMRARSDSSVSFEDDLLLGIPGAAPDEIAAIREQSEIINQAMQEMDPSSREIFIRFYYFGESVASIASTVSAIESTVKSKLHRARKRLRLILMERGYGCE